MDLQSIGYGIGLLILGGVTAYREFTAKRRQRMEEESGLRPNPTRCREHAVAINEIKHDIQRIKDHLGIV
ncbi:MAG: hypothetical protein M0R06_03270 [Sphaerochaeta sp.]|nr:hypothetical protein [Sphaerochaeta sp.]